MKRVIAASIVAVLVMSSGALAAIGDIGQQAQTWDLHLGGTAAMTTGTGSAGNIQGIGVLVGQNVTSTEGTSASQGIGAVLFQDTNVSTVGAPVSSSQTLDVDALALTTASGIVGPGQEQSINAYAGSGQQFEGILVTGNQNLSKGAGGTGTADGVNLVGVGLGQSAGNTSVTMGEGLLIVAGQGSNITGDTPASAGTVVTNASAQIVQIQNAN